MEEDRSNVSELGEDDDVDDQKQLALKQRRGVKRTLDISDVPPGKTLVVLLFPIIESSPERTIVES